MDTEDTSLYLNNLPENVEFNNEDVDKTKKDEETSPFDPKMSSREMRKIKYYEDMFARMDSENKPTSMNETQSTVSTLGKTRTRSLEKRKHTEHKTDKSTTSMDGLLQENVDSNYTQPRPGRKSMYKKPVGRPPSDPNYTNAKSNQNENQTEEVLVDRKTMLDNKRLIRVQSMPMVTKKPKVPLPPAVEPKQPESRLTSRRSKVSRWDIKTSFASVAAQADTSLNLVEQSKEVVSNLENETNKNKEMLETNKNKELLESNKNKVVLESSKNKQERKEDLKEEVPLVENLKYEDTRTLDTVHELPVSELVRTETLDQETEQDNKEDTSEQEQPEPPESEEYKDEAKEETVEVLPPEFETKVEQYYPVEEIPYVVPVKKKSNRGRKAKHKRASPDNVYIPEPVLVEPEKLLPMEVEELAPLTPLAEFVEEVKPAPRGRGKSQRAKKKKQEYYEERVVSKPKYAGKSGKGPGRGHSTTDRDKSQLQAGRKDLGDFQEEKFISIENLRMITMEDAEKMLNLCTKKNTDLETLRGMINSICTDSYRPEVEAMKTGEKNRFLLDPSNIIAPTMVYNQNTVETPVPENPIHISFKYRFFHDLNKF